MEGEILVAYHMACSMYEIWYKTQVSPKLDKEAKLAVARKISDISLRMPIYEPRIYIDKSEVPELAPLTKLDRYTGMFLYVVMTEISRELGLPVKHVSDIVKER
jgi:hypothetical protein